MPGLRDFLQRGRPSLLRLAEKWQRKRAQRSRVQVLLRAISRAPQMAAEGERPAASEAEARARLFAPDGPAQRRRRQ